MTVLVFPTVNTDCVPLGGDVNADENLVEWEREEKKLHSGLDAVKT